MTFLAVAGFGLDRNQNKSRKPAGIASERGGEILRMFRYQGREEGPDLRK